MATSNVFHEDVSEEQRMMLITEGIIYSKLVCIVSTNKIYL